VFSTPRHPYTQALVSAIPNYHAGRRVQRVRLDGEPRSPIDPDPQTCRFYGRCPQGEARCETEAPALRSLASGQHVACHFALAASSTTSMTAEAV